MNFCFDLPSISVLVEGKWEILVDKTTLVEWMRLDKLKKYKYKYSY